MGSTPRLMSHRPIRSPGKSNFLKFMLAWLLSDGQVVLLCDNDRTYLFYRGRVYNRRTEVGFIDLPVHRAAPNRSVWAPIDVNYLDGGPPIRSDPIAWPIQASSPIPIRWRSWHKQFNAALWGMPLWNLEELIEGCAFCSFYPSIAKSITNYPVSLQPIPFAPLQYSSRGFGKTPPARWWVDGPKNRELSIRRYTGGSPPGQGSGEGGCGGRRQRRGPNHR